MHFVPSCYATTNAVSLPSREWDDLQHAAFRFLWERTSPDTGLTADTTEESPASTAVTGMMLTSLCIGVERGWCRRAEAAQRARTALRFFARDAFHCGGLFYHFMDRATGRRKWKCEVSSVDSALLFYGALVAATYFDSNRGPEEEIRALATEVFERADWNLWRQNEPGLCLWWKPEYGFSRYRWTGYSEAILLYLLGMGSPSHTLPRSSYEYYTGTYTRHKTYGREWIYCGPLFTHLFPHLWLDLRHFRDRSPEHNNYWLNTHQAVHIQQAYGEHNPRGHAGYSGQCWGLSACDGPGEIKKNGQPRLYAYRARGAPFGPDDGTLSPPAAIASFVFQPEIAAEAHDQFRRVYPDLWTEYGLRGAVHPGLGWHCTPCYGLDQGMLCILLENARSGLIWEISRRCEVFKQALRRVQQ
jgi:hypothetical protein